MKRLALALVVGVLAAGCNPGGEPTNPPEALNPTGQPRTAEEGQVAQERAAAGQRSDAAMAEAARKMREAQGK